MTENHTVIGCTLINNLSLELMDDGTLSIRISNTDHKINLGPAIKAAESLRYALDRLEIHFKPEKDI